MSAQPSKRRTRRIFISYAHDDTALARRVCKALAERGLQVSDPDRDHIPGQNWAGEVARALEESDSMVVLLTPAALGSHAVLLENPAPVRRLESDTRFLYAPTLGSI